MSMIKCSSSGLRGAFDLLDTDRDGRISGEDLRAFYSARQGSSSSSSSGGEDEFYDDNSGSSIDKEMIGTMISVADSNKDGFVEYNEFEQLLCSSAVHTGGGSTSNNNINAKQDIFGEITTADDDEPSSVSSCTMSMGAMMEQVFKLMDTDGDGKISFQDLKRYMELATPGIGLSDDDVNAMLLLGGAETQQGYVSYQAFIKIISY